MNHRLKQLRDLGLATLKHNHHHFQLKNLISRPFEREKRYWPLATGLLMVGVMVIAWTGQKNSKEIPNHAAAPALYSNGYEKGMTSSQELGGANFNLQPSIPHQSETMETNENVSSYSINALAKSLIHSNKLSQTGGVDQIKTLLLQKSLLTTFYLGETTNKVGDALENDTQLLREMENVLSVDLFEYLSQNTNRADTLKKYIDLMITLEKKASTRQNELATTISFLENNINAQEEVLKNQEEGFFTQLESFNGNGLNEGLDSFLTIQKEQAEAKAKAGAYGALKGYYDYYQPLLTSRIEATQLNKDALIAGVKVVDLPGVDLGLIVEPE